MSNKCSLLYCSGFFLFWVILGNVIILPSALFSIKYKYVAKNRHVWCFFIQQILNNYVQFEVYSGLSQVASLKMSQSRVSDGEWHHLLIELKSAKDGKDIKYLAVMSLDYGMYQIRQHHNCAPKHYRNVFRSKQDKGLWAVICLIKLY